MVSFTGSTRAGILVAKAAADTVKRVHQELGGKSPNIVLPDADLAACCRHRRSIACFINTGQSCIAPTRMLVQKDREAEAVGIHQGDVRRHFAVGDPQAEGGHIGPVVNKAQFDKIQGLIQSAIDEGATLETGGTGLPERMSTAAIISSRRYSRA
jgi:aldehyde dehydrogenase (NAD+)